MLAFVDVETTGLSLVRDALLEVAVVLTDDHLHIRELEQVVIHRPNITEIKMDDYVRNMHTENGLLEECGTGGVWLAEAEATLRELMSAFGAVGSPMCGSSVQFDRSFIERDMPDLASDFHRYRNLDVSSFKEAFKHWGLPAWVRETHKTHRALDDIVDSINELAFYKKHLLR